MATCTIQLVWCFFYSCMSGNMHTIHRPSGVRPELLQTCLDQQWHPTCLLTDMDLNFIGSLQVPVVYSSRGLLLQAGAP